MTKVTGTSINPEPLSRPLIVHSIQSLVTRLKHEWKRSDKGPPRFYQFFRSEPVFLRLRQFTIFPQLSYHFESKPHSENFFEILARCNRFIFALLSSVKMPWRRRWWRPAIQVLLIHFMVAINDNNSLRTMLFVCS